MLKILNISFWSDFSGISLLLEPHDMMSMEVKVDLLETLNYLYSLSFSLVGRDIAATNLLKESLAYSDRFTRLLQGKPPILLNTDEILDLEEFLLNYYLKSVETQEKRREKANEQDKVFYNLSAKERFELAKFAIESDENLISLRDEFVEPITNLGVALGLKSFRVIKREEIECVLTRTALVRLLQTKEAMSFKEHTSVCPACFKFEKQFHKDLLEMKKVIPLKFGKFDEDALEDLIFEFENPEEDYAYIAIHKAKKAGKKFFSFLSENI